jgi:hypothetical protein
MRALAIRFVDTAYACPFCHVLSSWNGTHNNSAEE